MSTRDPFEPIRDSLLTCVDCGRAFLFTAGEYHLLAYRGLPAPRRCPACRAQGRVARDEDASRGRRQGVGQPRLGQARSDTDGLS